jgi:putative transposase
MDEPPQLHDAFIHRDREWLDWVNTSLTDAELDAMRNSVNRGTPFDNSRWQKQIAKRLGLESDVGRELLATDRLG